MVTSLSSSLVRIGYIFLTLAAITALTGCPPPKGTLVRMEEKIDHTNDQLDSIQQQQQMVIDMLEELVALARLQGTGEITLVFPPGLAHFSRQSLEYERLVRFLDYVVRESRGRRVLFVSVGSASAMGSWDFNQNLSEKRARAPLPVIDTYLTNVPHETLMVYGTGEQYAAAAGGPSIHRRDRHVRLIAVYDDQMLPVTLPGRSPDNP